MLTTSNKPKQLIVLIGPTAVGKTKLSVQLAHHFATEIISADARQCYKYMDIGTAKPTRSERAEAVHHLVDFLPLEKNYSAGAFERDVLKLLDTLWTRHQQVILTGGSGLYIKAVCQGLANMPVIPQGLYNQLDAFYKQKGLNPLLQLLAQKDPAYYAQVDKKNPRRIIRALAVCEASGKPYAHFRSEKPLTRPFQVIKIGLTLPKEILYQRVNHRVDAMVQEGLFEEAKRLYAHKDLPCFKTIGYQEVFDFLEGKYSKQETIDRIKQHTRHYAKRQLTWFRNDPDIMWFAPTDELAIKAYLESRLRK